jgi:hypothetical protein
MTTTVPTTAIADARIPAAHPFAAQHLRRAAAAEATGPQAVDAGGRAAAQPLPVPRRRAAAVREPGVADSAARLGPGVAQAEGDPGRVGALGVGTAVEVRTVPFLLLLPRGPLRHTGGTA